LKTHLQSPQLWLLLLICIFSAVGLTKLEEDLANRSLVSDRSETSNDGDSLITLQFKASSKPKLDFDFLKKLSAELERWDKVREVIGPTNLTGLQPLFNSELNWDELSGPLSQLGSETSLVLDPIEQTWSILLLLESDWANHPEATSWPSKLQVLFNRSSFEHRSAIAVGLPLIKLEVSRIAAQDRAFILPLVVIVMLLLLRFLLGQWSQACMVLLGAIPIELVVLGSMGWLGIAMNPLLGVVPPTLLVISLIPSCHVMWAIKRQHGKNTIAHQVKHGLLEVRRPNTLAGITTIAGFLSLCFYDVAAIRQFGFANAAGCCCSLIWAHYFLPNLVTTVFQHQPLIQTKAANKLTFISNIGKKLQFHPFLIILLSIILACLSGYGLKGLKKGTDLLSFLPTDSTVVQNTLAYDKKKGSLLLELNLSSQTQSTLWDEQGLKAQQKLMELIMAKNDHVVLSGFNVIYNHLTQSIPAITPTDNNTALFQKVREQILASNEASFFKQLLLHEHKLKIYQLCSSLNSALLVQQVESLTSKVQSELPGYQFSIKGEALGFAKDSEAIVEQQLKSLVMAMIVVFTMIAFIFPNAKVLFCVLIVNALPLLIVYGLMGWGHWPLDVGSAMILCVSLGMVVDDTVHFLSHLKNLGHYSHKQLHVTLTEVGPVLTATTLILVLGFACTLLGDFAPTRHFGGLTALTLSTALLADLWLLPCLLNLISKFNKAA